MKRGINIWRHVKYNDSENFKNIVDALLEEFGQSLADTPYVKNFLYKWYESDIKNHGGVCCLCFNRFSVQKFNTFVCPDCLKNRIIGISQYNKTKETHPHAVYSLLAPTEDGKGRIVYIGVTKNPEARFIAHTEDKEFVGMSLEWFFTDRKEAEEWELIRIAQTRPPQNKAIVEINSIDHLFEKHKGKFDNYTK